MKQIIFLAALLLPLLILNQTHANDLTKSDNGSKKGIKVNRDIAPFTGVKACSGINVYLFQGETEKVVVEANEKIIDCLKTEVKGSILHCYIDCNIHFPSEMNVYVNYKTLNTIISESGADVFGETKIQTDSLDIVTNSGADVKVEVDTKTLRCIAESGSDALIKGSADYFKGSASSGADIIANDLTANTCDANTSSAGDIKITVTKSIEANASSGGDITYYGNPEKEYIKESSGGNVSKR